MGKFEFAKHSLFCLSLLTVTYVSASPRQNKASAAMPEWQALIPAIEKVLTSHRTCPDDRMRAYPVDAANFAGSSFALVDACPLGAYTELIVVMRLEASQPAFAHFRKLNHTINVEFAQGSSVMHGSDVRLVPEKRAIYDVSWDYDGETHQLESCLADAYVWNNHSMSFNWDAHLTKQATREHCHALKKQVD